MHTTGADPALYLLYVRKALLHLVLDHVVFSLVAPIPRFSEQKCLTSIPGGWWCDGLCYYPCSWSPPLALVNDAGLLENCTRRSLRLQYNSSCITYSLSVHANGFFIASDWGRYLCSTWNPITTTEEALTNQMDKMMHPMDVSLFLFSLGPWTKWLWRLCMDSTIWTFPRNNLAKCD